MIALVGDHAIFLLGLLELLIPLAGYCAGCNPLSSVTERSRSAEENGLHPTQHKIFENGGVMVSTGLSTDW